MQGFFFVIVVVQCEGENGQFYGQKDAPSYKITIMNDPQTVKDLSPSFKESICILSVQIYAD